MFFGLLSLEDFSSALLTLSEICHIMAASKGKSREARERPEMKGINAKELKKALDTGVKVTVRVLKELWDESISAPGMLADVTFINQDDELIKFRFDFNAHKDTYLKLQTSGWFLGSDRGTGTAIEASIVKENDIFEDVYFDDNDVVPVEIVADGPCADYLKDKKDGKTDKNYLEWLEDEVRALRGGTKGEVR